MPVEHGQLIDKSRLAGAYVVCLLGISGQDREGWLVLADGLLTLGIAPFRQLQQGVVEVVLHRGSPASGTSGVCGYLPSVFPLTQAAADEARRSSPNA